MKIQLFDRGTAKGKKLFIDLQAICQRLSIEDDPEFIHDMSRVYSKGLTGETILLIDGEAVIIDQYPSSKELEIIVSDYLK